MILDKKVTVTIKFGPKLVDSLVIDASRAEIRFDGNSFMIRGLFLDNVIKVEDSDAGNTK